MIQTILRRSLMGASLCCALLPLWSCSAMNSDIADPVKAQTAETIQSRSGFGPALKTNPGLLAAQGRKAPIIDDDMDLEPELSSLPLTPGQTGTLLEPEVTDQPTTQVLTLTPEQRRILSEKSGLDFDLDLFDSREVERYFAYYTGPARESFSRWLKRAERHLPHVREALSRNGLPQDLAMLPFAESGYNCEAYSWAGAGGMWQFMPYTGRKYGLTVDWWVDERRDPKKATEAASKYLAFLNDMFGDWYLALAAYNAGEGKISRALEGTNSEDFFELLNKNDRLSKKARLKIETQHYVPKFVAITKIFQNLEALGFEPVRWDAAPNLEVVQVPGGTDLLALAKSGGLTWDEFHALNPAFRRQVSPPDRHVMVSIPVERKHSMLAYLENPATRPYEGFLTHQVRKGETLRGLAKRYGVPQEVLSQINGQTLKPGEYVMIPASSKGEAVPGRLTKTRTIATKRSNYVVGKNDNMWSITRKFKVSAKTLLLANGLASSKGIKPGMKLYIPDSNEQAAKKTGKQAAKAREQVAKAREQVVKYTVREGDTLFAVSRKFGVTAEALKDWNKLKGTNIRPGDNLKVYQ